MRRSVGLPDRDGLLVRGVEDDSPAAPAGITRGDLIVAVAGKPVTDSDELLDAISAAKQPYEILLVRGADEVTVTIGAAKPPARTRARASPGAHPGRAQLPEAAGAARPGPARPRRPGQGRRPRS